MHYYAKYKTDKIQQESNSHTSYSEIISNKNLKIPPPPPPFNTNPARIK